MTTEHWIIAVQWRARGTTVPFLQFIKIVYAPADGSYMISLS